jgi:glutathione S-transferase
MPQPTLIYFPARGRAELIRLILAEAGVAYVEHPIGKDTPPLNGRPTDFAELKASGQLAFEAVPVWEEADGFRLAQSLAIANHLARQHGLMGKSPREQALVEQALGGYDDARAELRRLFSAAPEARAAVREELLSKGVPKWLGDFERLLQANGLGYLVGDVVTSADLALWYFVELCEGNGFGAALEKTPLVRAHFERIGKRPNIAAYVASPKRYPFAPLPK